MTTESEAKSAEIKRKSKFQQNPVETIVKAIIILIVSCFVAFYDLPRFVSGKGKSYQERCFSNQRVLLGAIEMYNLDNKEMLREYNPNSLDLLIKGKYLKAEWMENFECEFYSEGDLLDDGFIYCLNHGAIDGKKEGKDIEASLTPKKDSRKRLTNNLTKLAIAIGPALFYLLIKFL